MARSKTRVVLRLVDVIPVDEDRLLQALDLPVPDYEDAVQIACAGKAGVDLTVTRKRADFARTDVEVLSPVELLARLDPGR